MTIKTLPQVSFLRQLLEYDSSKGALTWLHRAADTFQDKVIAANKRNKSYILKADGQATNWNNRFAGRQAGTLDHNGYITVEIVAKKYPAHRLIWALNISDSDFNGEIDHINGNRSDNRLHNLRLVSPTDNAKNKRKRTTNQSGITGVGFYRRRWRATITSEGKTIFLGCYLKKEDAVKSRKDAEKVFGFHPNHDRN